MSIEIFKQLISESARVELNQNGKRASVTLTEPEVSDSSVEIRGVPDSSIVIKVDKFPAPNQVFSGLKGECKRADYAIISCEKGKKRVLIIELKRANGTDSKEIIKQLKGGACFINYCEAVAAFFYNGKEILRGYEFRFISFANTHIRKRKTRIECKSDKHNRPESFFKLHYA